MRLAQRARQDSLAPQAQQDSLAQEALHRILVQRVPPAALAQQGLLVFLELQPILVQLETKVSQALLAILDNKVIQVKWDLRAILAPPVPLVFQDWQQIPAQQAPQA